GLLRASELDSVDARFSIRGAEAPPAEIALVLIDDVSFDELDEQWPFPRSMHATVIDRLRRDGARAVAYDIQFTEPTVPREDNALINAVAKMGTVTLATSEVDREGRSNVFGGESVLRSVDARAGHSDFEPDPGATIRKVPFATGGLESFSIVAAESATEDRISRDDLGGSDAWIDFRGGTQTFPAISFSRVLRGRFAPGTFRNKIVVVGAGAPTLQDIHATSTASEGLMMGPEVQANAIATALDGFPLQSSPLGADLYLIAAMGFVVPLGSLRFRPLVALAGGLGATALYLVAAQIAFENGAILPVVYPLLALTVGTIGTLAVHYSFDALERVRTRDTFARFVPAAVVDEALDKAGSDVRLGGEKREVTVMISDLRGFTAFSESLEADVLVEILNRYLTAMTEAIMAEGGTLVAYLGDGIMAVFGAPLDQPDHAARALAAAREMTGSRLAEFNEWVKASGHEPMRMGVGLNSGEVMSGNVGSPQRLEYTAIGDTTNVAARLEPMTKGSGHQVFVSETTFELLGPAERADLEPKGEMAVRGRERGISVWALQEGDPYRPEAPQPAE
ncbi:MAG: CHASE2 domain-containing protein, partial [Solirubrobacterales bacterium]